MSGLEIGKQYVVEATKTDNGYTIDQYQWMNGTHNKALETIGAEAAPQSQR